jgi:hypothetical protein
MLFGSAVIVLRVGSWELVVNFFACRVRVKEFPFFRRKKGMVGLCHAVRPPSAIAEGHRPGAPRRVLERKSASPHLMLS